MQSQRHAAGISSNFIGSSRGVEVTPVAVITGLGLEGYHAALRFLLKR